MASDPLDMAAIRARREAATPDPWAAAVEAFEWAESKAQSARRVSYARRTPIAGLRAALPHLLEAVVMQLPLGDSEPPWLVAVDGEVLLRDNLLTALQRAAARLTP